MAAELIELLRFDCKNVTGKSVQLYQTKFQGNCQLLVRSTQGKQIYVLTSNVLTVKLLKFRQVLRGTVSITRVYRFKCIKHTHHQYFLNIT